MRQRLWLLVLGVILGACGQSGQNLGSQLPGVPAGNLTGLTGEYRDSSGRSYIQLDRSLAFDWDNFMPLEAMPQGGFSAVWTGQLVAPESGRYTLSLEGTGEATLTLAGQEVVTFGKKATVQLAGGQAYALRLEYRKTGEKAKVVLRWSLEGQDTLEPKVVPASVFRTAPPLTSEVQSQNVALGSNLLRNADFEGGSGLWVRYSGTKTDVAGRTSAGGVAASDFAWIQQDLPNTALQGGLTYTLRVWGRASAGSCTAGVGFGSGASDSRTLTFQDTAWTQQTASFTLPLSATYIAVYLTSGSGTCTYDDAELIASDPNAGGGTPPAATPSSPIVNPDFAFGTQGWDRFGGNVQASNQTLAMAPYTWLQQNLGTANLQSGQQYTLSANLRSLTAGQECRMGLVVSNGTATEVATVRQSATTAQTQTSAAFTMPSGLAWAAVYISSSAANCEIRTVRLQVAAGTGLLGEYYDNANFTGTREIRTDPTVNFDWGTGSPAAGIGADTFSVRWTGEIVPRFSGAYTFYTTSDDGVRLWVNGQLIINNWTIHAPTVDQGNISLTAGQRYSIRMELYEEGGGAVARLEWQSAQQAREIIPASQLYPASAPVNNSRAIRGEWGRVIGVSLVPVTAANLPDGRVMLWSGTDRASFGAGTRRTYTSLFNPDTETATEVLVTETQHEMFCPGTAQLPDGRIMLAGGGNAEVTSIYNPATGTWSRVQNMTNPRGYQANVTLSNGNVFTLGGSWSGAQGGKNGEVWNAATGWSALPGALVAPALTNDPGGVYRADNHMWLFAIGGGNVLQAGPSANMNLYGTSGSGSVSGLGARGNDGDSMNGNAVMYDIGKILTIGGAPAYSGGAAKTNAFVVSVSGTSASVARTGSMSFARVMHNSVALPNGSVLAVGGQEVAAPFSDARSILTPELWSPATGTWLGMADLSVPRNYHSVALLLPDGRVLAGGGGLCGSCTTNHPDVQLFSPPYLFNPDGSPATRPTITAAPATGRYGTSISVSTGGPVSQFVLMRFSSVTHSTDTDQRRVPLTFSGSGTSYTVQLPADPGIAPPGNYMLFALNAAGVPSRAPTIRIGN